LAKAGCRKIEPTMCFERRKRSRLNGLGADAGFGEVWMATDKRLDFNDLGGQDERPGREDWALLVQICAGVWKIPDVTPSLASG
jgi:hypothetical protein